MDAGDFKHELLNRLKSTMAVNVLIAGLCVGILNNCTPTDGFDENSLFQHFSKIFSRTLNISLKSDKNNKLVT